MAFVDEWEKRALSGDLGGARIGIFVKTDDGTWCNINKHRATDAGGVLDVWYDRLVENPIVTVGAEIESGLYTARSNNLLIKDPNGDCFSLPWTLYDDSGTAHTLTERYNAEVRISFGAKWTGSWEYQSLGTFLLKNVKPNSDDETVTWFLKGKESLLADISIRDFKLGDSWPSNISASRLVEDLISLAHNGQLSFESGSPGGPFWQESQTEDRIYAGPMGHFPVLNDDRTWNFKRTDDPRCSDSSDNIMVFGGHNLDERPTVWKWTKQDSGDTWEQWSINTPGYEIIHVAIDGDDVLCWLTCNKLITGFGWPYVCQQSKVIQLHTDTGDYAVITGSDRLMQTNRFHNLASYPDQDTPEYSHDYWGYYDVYNPPQHTIYGNWPALPVPFWSSARIVPKDSTYFSNIVYSSTLNNEANQYEIERLTGPGDYHDGSPSLVHHPYKGLQPGYYIGIYDYHAVSADEHGVNTWLHTDSADSVREDVAGGRHWWIEYINRQYYLRYMTSDATEGYQIQLIMPEHVLPGDPPSSIVAGDDYYYHANVITSFDIQEHPDTGEIWLLLGIHRGFHELNHLDLWRPYLVPAVELYAKQITSYVGLPNQVISVLATDKVDSTQGNENPDWESHWFPILCSARLNTGSDAGSGMTPYWGQFCNLLAAGGACYGIWTWENNDFMFGGRGRSQWPIGDPILEPMLPKSTAPLSIAQKPDSSKYWHIIDQATGALWKVKFEAVGLVSVEQLTIGSVDEENTWQLCPPLSMEPTAENAIVIGVSASAPAAQFFSDYDVETHYQGTPTIETLSPGGRITAWVVGRQIPDCVPYADLGDVKLDKAIQQAQQICGNITWGFNSDGDFMFKARTRTASGYTIRRARDTSGMLSEKHFVLEARYLDWEKKDDDIANSMAVQAYIAQIQTPDVLSSLGFDSTADEWHVSIIQTSARSQRLILRCVSGGAPKRDSNDRDRPLLFSWHTELNEVNTTLTEDVVVPTDVLSIGALRGLHRSDAGYPPRQRYYVGDTEVFTDDFIKIGNSAWGRLQLNENTLWIDPPLTAPTDFPKGMRVEIRSQGRHSSGNSSEGLFTNGLAAATLTQGTPITLDIGGGYVDNIKPGMLIYSENSTWLHQVVSVSTDDEQIRIIPGVLESAEEGEEMFLAAGEWFYATIWVEYPDTAYSIGRSGVSFALTSRNRQSETSGRFQVGDAIIINCHGAEMIEAKQCVYKSEDPESIARYGKKEWKLRGKNKMITVQRAPHLLPLLKYYRTPQSKLAASNLLFLPYWAPGYYFSHIDTKYYGDSTSRGMDILQTTWDTKNWRVSVKGSTYFTDVQGRGDAESEDVTGIAWVDEIGDVGSWGL